MSETLEQLHAIGKSGRRRVAMATLVATRGATPRREGARMWVAADGAIVGSVTIGGCIDARVVEASERVLESDTPELLSLSLGDEDAWDVGLTCGGTLDVLVEPVQLGAGGDSMAGAYAAVRARLEAGGRAVVVALLRHPRARLVVLDDGTCVGSLGTHELDDEAAIRAAQVMEAGASTTLALERAAGSPEGFFELHTPPRTLHIFGAGAVAVELVRLAGVLGMRTSVVDGRPRLATRERFPEACDLRVGIPSEIAGALTYGPSTAVILLAHDYKYDLPVLRSVLRSAAGYIGLLGSRRRGTALLGLLREEGIEPHRLDAVHVPIGLDIGARTAAEIALSILAEVVAVGARRPGGSLSGSGAP